MFDYVIHWLIKNWEMVLSILLFLLSFILCLVKKKPVLNKVAIYLNELFQRIPIYIDMVEKDGHGVEKKRLVLELCKQYLISEFGFYDFDVIEKLISDHIEDVLNAPQKKEKFYNFDD